MTSPPDLLTVETVGPYLCELGVLEDPCVEVHALGGGVSNVVLAIDGPTPMVVKQSLPKLRVETSWSAPQSRTVTEAEALSLCSLLTPGRAPRLLHVDPDRYVVCLERAPVGWQDWKTTLMSGVASTDTARILGTVLAAWHGATTAGRGITPRMSDPYAFEVLRLDPYFRTVADRDPTVAGDMESVIEQLRSHRTCLVHGDFSPKNILTGPEAADVTVIDFEVAHVGDPAFDVAFLLAHLTLKSIHLPAWTERIDGVAREFLDAYGAAVPEVLRPELAAVVRYTGALLLARVKGKSPAEYLDDIERRHAWALGIALLRDPASTLEALSVIRRSTAP